MEPLNGIAYGPAIAAAAGRHGLDPSLLAAVAAQETGGPGSASGRNIVGDGGHGHGLFQIDDRWHAFAKTPAAMDPAVNADYAAGMLQGLLGRYGGDLHAALSAYNAGSPNAAGSVTDWGGGLQLGYADSVLRHYGEIAASTGGAVQSVVRVGTAAQAVASLAGAASSDPSTAGLGLLQALLGAGTSASLSLGAPYPPIATAQSGLSSQNAQQVRAAQQQADALTTSLGDGDPSGPSELAGP
jgi:hypothetical protein